MNPGGDKNSLAYILCLKEQPSLNLQEVNQRFEPGVSPLHLRSKGAGSLI
jgi:hypothetical protein